MYCRVRRLFHVLIVSELFEYTGECVSHIRLSTLYQHVNLPTKNDSFVFVVYTSNHSILPTSTPVYTV